MSLDAEFTTSTAAVGLASANQLWSAARTRPSPDASEAWRSGAARRRQHANRLMAGALLLTLALGAATTLAWAESSIQGTQIGDYPPLLWPLVLFVTGIVVSIVANAVARPTQPPRLSVRPESARELPSLLPGGAAETPVPASPPAATAPIRRLRRSPRIS